MMKRSELKKRSAAAVEEPQYDVTCPACDERFPRHRVANYRENGNGECPECGAEIDLATLAKPTPEVKAKPDGTPSGKFCGVCGASILLMKEKLWLNCGHTLGNAMPVTDPKQARSYGPPAGAPLAISEPRIPSPKKNDPGEALSTASMSASPPAPKVVVEGDRISIEWGKSVFPVAAFNSNFTVGGFFVSTMLAPGANKVAEADRILAELQAIADRAFAAQAEWYRKKLASLKE